MRNCLIFRTFSYYPRDTTLRKLTEQIKDFYLTKYKTRQYVYIIHFITTGDYLLGKCCFTNYQLPIDPLNEIIENQKFVSQKIQKNQY